MIRMKSTWRRATRQVTPGNLVRYSVRHNAPVGRDDTAPVGRDDTAPAGRDDTAPAGRGDRAPAAVSGARRGRPPGH
ncbi:hypothetical protein GCM10009613_39900 [Pseudonocardia kongjuensis]|uniref:Uncharacterized protein n=1 Tax=Pseudonocardia kongjuensis TaxID=102227 RepID=A0ABN1XYY5_9PSEU